MNRLVPFLAQLVCWPAGMSGGKREEMPDMVGELFLKKRTMCFFKMLSLFKDGEVVGW